MHTILILDDEQKHLFATKQYLKQHGFKVFVSNSPLHAIELLQKLTPDLLILDIMMPYMSGYTFIKKLKTFKQLSTIPFVFLTAKGMTQDRIKAYNLGCSGYISKPFDPDELIALISNILDKEYQREKEVKDTIKHLKGIREYLQQQYYVFNFNSLNFILTPQENKVLSYVIKGLKNKEIANKLQTSVRNIEKYITRLLNKTQTQNRTDLVRFIYSNNFSELTENSKANDGDRTRE